MMRGYDEDTVRVRVSVRMMGVRMRGSVWNMEYGVRVRVR